MLDLLNEKKSLNVLDACLQKMKPMIVTDSKNMYDSVMRIETSGLQLEERRLAVEVLSYRDRPSAAGIDCRRVDSDQQLADVLSKAFHCESFQKGFRNRKFPCFSTLLLLVPRRSGPCIAFYQSMTCQSDWLQTLCDIGTAGKVPRV